MAAALAAAAEYGRRTGAPAPFEALRRTPAALGEVLPDGRTRMLSLFQATGRGRRIMKLWGRLGRGKPRMGWKRSLAEVLRAYWFPLLAGALVPVVVAVVLGAEWTPTVVTLTALVALTAAVLSLVWAAWRDFALGAIDNELGLCKGGTLEPDGPEGRRPGLSEWLHDGIQAGAGLKKTDAPLTFRDLWNAPDYPGAPQRPCGDGDPVQRRAINLQVITTNVAHGRPYRLPLVDAGSRLFFRRQDLVDYFPGVVLDALEKGAPPYRKRTSSDPPGIPDGFLELPRADLPIVVAARLSLSYPLLFSAVPLWAIDYEEPVIDRRTLKRCLFTDGGVSSNFPIHMFDQALPRWPTFGLWLDRRSPYPAHAHQDVWLPEFQGQGWGDSWNRFDPQAAGPSSEAVDPPGKSRPSFLLKFLVALGTGAADWRDRTSFRMPHVRNRVARLMLESGEGGLNIGMPREQILGMAYRYGTCAGKLFVKRFADKDGQASQAWREQRWVRLEVLIRGVQERLAGFARTVGWTAHTFPLRMAIYEAVKHGPIHDRGNCAQLDDDQAETLARLLDRFEELEQVLGAARPRPFEPVPEPELRLRAPL
jgi:hypothetical protein